MTCDIAIVSLGTTLGWQRADTALAGALNELGCSCQIVPVRIGAAGRLRRSMATTDAVEALAARRSAAGVSARAIVFSSITAALLQRKPKLPHAVRFDSLATLSRPGPGGAWQRRREPAVLARADLLLPWGETAAQAARALVSTPAIVTLPVPIEPLNGGQNRDLGLVAYAGNPAKRGLDLLCRAWTLAARPGDELVIGGIDGDAARRWLHRAGVREPAGVRWAGRLPHREWLALVARARGFVNASRYEDWGIAQLEALASGTPLVTVATPGPNEALALARRLNPELVAAEPAPPALAEAIRRALSLPAPQRHAYGEAAMALLEPFRPEAVRHTLERRVLPVLLASSS